MRRVLFVCVRNSARSQMAEAWARSASGGSWEAASAGSLPSGFVDLGAVRAMAERGVSLAGHRSKGFDDLPVRVWDAVVSLGCGEETGRIPARRRLDWPIADPAGLGPESYRRCRDEIERRVRELIGAPA